MNSINLGFIGASRGLQLAQACAFVPGVEPALVYDVDPIAVAKVESETGVLAAPTLDALLLSDVDAIVVASPIPLHLEHVTQVVNSGKHVISEVTACATLEEARDLVSVINSSGKIYIFAENYCYFTEIEIVKRLQAEGRFGDVYFAESDHVLDIRELWRTSDGELTWRGRGGVGVYCTHSLGPLLTIMDDRVTWLSAMRVEGGKFDPEVRFPTMHLLQMTTEKGATIRVRIDLVSPRPPLHAYYAIQGTRGSYESWRGLGDESKFWLEDEHGPSEFRDFGEWHRLDELRERYLSAEWEPVPGHEGRDQRMMSDFAAVLRGEMDNPFDVYRGLDFQLPGLLADKSAEAKGSPLLVPDPRDLD